MATVTVVRYKRRKRIGDEKSPMVYALKLKSGEAKIYSIETLARENRVNRVAFGGRRVARHEIFVRAMEEGLGGRR